jgi:hypothetical protein
MGKIPSISQVIARIVRPGQENDLGEDAIKDSGRGLRLIHGKLRTRDASKGIELNFIKRIMQEKKIVEGFEKEIGDALGKSEARKMLKKVGVHLGIFDFNPKINAQQTEQLDGLFKKALETKPPETKPPGMKESIDGGRRKWSGRFSLNNESTTQMLKEMKTHFNFHFRQKTINQKDKIFLPTLFVSELKRANIILDDGVTSTNLKDKEPAGAQAHVEAFVGGNPNAAYNLCLVLTPHTMFFADKALGNQNGLTAEQLAGSDQFKQLTYRVQKTTDQFKITVDQENYVDTLHCHRDEHSYNHALEGALSTHGRKMGLVIAHAALADGNADGLELDEPPEFNFEGYPKANDPPQGVNRPILGY